MKFRTGLLMAAALLMQASVSVAAQKKAEGAPRSPVTVTSDTMEARSGEGRVVFKGNVVAVEDFTLCSDELHVTYGDGSDIKSIEASGNVRIFQDRKSSTSAHAVYDRRERIIVLTGEPHLRQCSDSVRGEKITVYLDQENALVEGGNGGRVRAVIMPNKDCPENDAPEKYVSEEARCKGTR
ncbi:MAG: lipopolysaccharide transport periplasmic protein LptA [Deltaproteobacteria bacterium]|nr:lipopolysaccharide transport periplasmic protein LptA [Deltaproteobacteria bacterium]MBZ0218836.1 lipopolysaccharide transport periplasmic protein LptA [Deltaproteobacteria bacterium]